MGLLGILLRILPTAMAMDGMIYKMILRTVGDRRPEPDVSGMGGFSHKELEGQQ